jgi:hypothetical protein
MKAVFLSFSAEDTLRAKDLMPLLDNPQYSLDFYDGLLGCDSGENLTEQVKREIGQKITRSGITVCLIGENTHKSKLVDCELQKSRHKGNKIIAMALKKVESAVLPAVIKEENLRFYPWDYKKLTGLILEDARDFPFRALSNLK